MSTPGDDPVAALGALADKHGSDKGFGVGNRHGYVRVYGSVFGEARERPLKLLEIGLSIARDGLTCPSLAMWADWMPNADVLGVDIQDFSKFQHERCRTRVVDQTDRDALLAMAKDEAPFDAIIDDGSHASDAQQMSFLCLFPALKPGGMYCIEDLHFQPPNEAPDAIKTRAVLQGWRQGLPPDVIARLAARHGFPRAHVAACFGEIAGLQLFDSVAPGRSASLMADALAVIQKAA